MYVFITCTHVIKIVMFKWCQYSVTYFSNKEAVYCIQACICKNEKTPLNMQNTYIHWTYQIKAHIAYYKICVILNNSDPPCFTCTCCSVITLVYIQISWSWISEQYVKYSLTKQSGPAYMEVKHSTKLINVSSFWCMLSENSKKWRNGWKESLSVPVLLIF